MNRTVSVIIPAYNREHYIEECISSVQCQSWQDFEILVVDDGSTDKTVEICTRLAQADSRIKLLTSPHAGVSAARNQALDAATGHYLFFLDSDDAIHPCLLEGLVGKVSALGVPMGFAGGCDIENESWGDRILSEFLRATVFDAYEHLTNQQLLQRFFMRTAILGRMGGVMITKAHLGTTRFDETLHIGEDVCFIYENIIKNADAVILQENGYFWREHSTRVSAGISYAAFLSRQRTKEFLWRSEEKFGRIQNANKEKAGAYKNFLISQTKNPVYSADNKKMRKSIKPYRKELFPALTKKQRMLFLLSAYTPGLFFIVHRSITFFKKRVNNNHRDCK